MKHKHTTRSALFTSIISMLLCVSMLVGATFAWFTDEVKSGVTMIAAGNLDIEVTNADGDSIEDLKTLFNDVTLWEPGAVAYEELTISNEGSLALKYAMSFAWEGENDLNGHKLSDVLKVAVLEADIVAGLDMEDRDAVLAAAKAATSGDLKTFSVSGSLYPAENAAAGEYTEREIHVVVYWEPSELDDLYNANNGQKTSDGKPLHIELGVVVKATQQMKEEDSFGDDYDERAEYPENTWLGDATYDWYNNPEGNTYTLTYASDLAGFANIVNGTAPSTMARSGYLPADSFEGKTVKLADSIDLNDLAWTPIGASGTAFKGTFDGGNFTIYNLNVNAAKRAGLFGYVIGKLNNVKIEGATIRGTDYAGALLGQGYAYIDNCHVVNADVIVTPEWDAAKNQYDGGAKAGGLVGQLCEGGMTLKNSSATKVNVRGYRDVGGLLGMAQYGNTVSGNAVEAVTVSYIPAEGYTPYADKKVNENISVLVGRIHASVKAVENNTYEGALLVRTADELAAAVANGTTNIYLLDGEYDVYGCGGKTLTINGSKNAVIKLYNEAEDGCDYGFDGSTVTFNGVTIDTTSNNGNYKGYARMNATFNNCSFFGAYTSHQTQTFNNCYFDFNNGYFWIWGAKEVTFNNCEFGGNSKAILAHGWESSVININNCDFAATEKGYTGSGDNTAAVEIDPAGTNTYAININGGSITDAYAGWIRVKDGSTNHEISVDGATVVTKADELVAALEADKDVVMLDNVKIDPAGMSNAYGTTGINVKNGQTIDGNGNTLDIRGAGGTWDSGINTTGGLIKNITVTGSFRGVFINHNSSYSERVVLENVTIQGTTYTISCDQGMNQGLTATNSTFNGWTSYAATLGDAKFVDCYFGEGNGYAYCRPYAPTTFVGCDFEAGFEMDARATVTFEDCSIGGAPLTAENLATLVTGNIANATVK